MLKLKPVLWPPDAKNWLIGKDPDAGKDWMQEEKGMTEDEMVGWDHWLGGHEFESALGVGDGQGSLAWCSPWVYKESDTTEDSTELRMRGTFNFVFNVLFFWLSSHLWQVALVFHFSFEENSFYILKYKSIERKILGINTRFLGGGNGNPLQYSCLENPMDRGAWRAAVHRVIKSQT